MTVRLAADDVRSGLRRPAVELPGAAAAAGRRSAGHGGLLVALVVVVKLGDIGAYTVGRLIGRHKMAPYLSPGKTIEGAVGGLVFACLGAGPGSLVWLLPRVVDGTIARLDWLDPFGIVVGMAGMLGDLAESLLKRDVGPQGLEHLAARLRRRARHRRLAAVRRAGGLLVLDGRACWPMQAVERGRLARRAACCTALRPPTCADQQLRRIRSQRKRCQQLPLGWPASDSSVHCQTIGYS